MNTFFDTLTRFLRAALGSLNLLDREGKLSLTNVTLVAMTVKGRIFPVVSATEAVTLFLALANYAHKRAENGQAADASDPTSDNALKLQLESIGTLQASFDDMQKRVSLIALKLGLGK